MRSKDSSIYKQYLLFLVFIPLILLGIAVIVSWVNYRIIQKERYFLYLTSAQKIESVINNGFRYILKLSEIMGDKIISLDKVDAYNIADILQKTVSVAQITQDTHLTTMFDFVTPDGAVVATSLHGIIANPHIVKKTDRTWMELAPKEPWKLHISPMAVQGIVARGQAIDTGIPVGYGIESNGKFLGTISSGIDISKLVAEIKLKLNSEYTKFVILTADKSQLVAHSYHYLPDEAQSFFRDSLRNIDIKSARINISYKDVVFFYAHSIKEYPYIVLIGEDSYFLNKEFREKILPIVLQVVAIGLFLLLLFYFFRKRIIVPVFNLSNIAYRLSRGETNIEIPYYNDIEINILADQLRGISTLQRELVIAKDKAEYVQEQLQHTNTDLEQRVVERTADLEKALSIKSEFLNNLSHEVKTPIGGIVTISEMLFENWHKYSDDFRYKQIKVLAHSGKRLLLLMNNLLDLSKFTAGKMSIEMSYGNLENLIYDMVDECKMLYLANKNIVIDVHVEAELDSDTIMDSARITQVLRNILSNAIKFTPTGTIRVSLVKQGKNLQVSVRDDGIGVPANELESIFEPFVQSSLTNTRSGGTGLGLAICKEIIRAHRGEIWAVNNLAKGITIYFIIPQLKVEAENQSEAEIVIEAPNQEVILMIDDDYSCHTAMSLLLESEGYEMRSAYGGIEGLEYIREHIKEIDLILLDLMMPDMYGLNVLQEIKADPNLQHLKVIIQSASSDMAERQRAFDLGADKFIPKPYIRNNVYLSIRRVLDGVVEIEDQNG
jgi:two-component system sensor histidine kinase ChiS